MIVDQADMITALRNQRNGALDENAQLYAMLAAKDREIAELKEEVKRGATGECANTRQPLER